MSSPYKKNDPTKDTTYTSYVQTLIQPLMTDLHIISFFACLLFYWIALSLIFWVLPISSLLKSIVDNSLIVFILRQVIFYGILFGAYLLGLICVPQRMYVQV